MNRVSIIVPALTLSLAAHAVAEEATGDCDGWTMTATADENDGSWYATATAELYRWNGSSWDLVDVSFDEGLLTDTFTDWGVFASVLVLGNNWIDELPAGDYRVYIESEGWASGMNGDWETIADVDVDFSGYPDTFFYREVTFSCDGPAVDARTPGYWKNHASAWPLLDVQLGDDVNATFARACLLELLDRPTRGDIRVKLAHHLIAAKLNLANGADSGAITGFPTATSTIVDTIAAADAALNSADIGCSGLGGPKPQGAAKAEIVEIKDALDAFNNNFE